MQFEPVGICRQELAYRASEPREGTEGWGRHSDAGIGRGAGDGDCGGRRTYESEEELSIFTILSLIIWRGINVRRGVKLGEICEVLNIVAKLFGLS